MVYIRSWLLANCILRTAGSKSAFGDYKLLANRHKPEKEVDSD